MGKSVELREKLSFIMSETPELDHTSPDIVIIAGIYEGVAIKLVI